MIAILVWLMLITIALVGIAVIGITARRELVRRHRTLDMAEDIAGITKQLHAINLQQHRELRAAVEQFIARCEADPITAERRYMDIQEMKNILHHGRR